MLTPKIFILRIKMKVIIFGSFIASVFAGFPLNPTYWGVNGARTGIFPSGYGRSRVGRGSTR